MTEFIINEIRENGIESFIIKEVMAIITEWDYRYSYIAVDYGEPYESVVTEEFGHKVEEILRNDPELTASAVSLREAAYLVYQQLLP